MKGTSHKKIAALLSMVETEKEMIALLEDLLTPEELESITKRMELLWLLKKDIPQREIREQLGCGIATVTRGNRIYKYGTGILMKYILKQKAQKKAH